MIWTALFLGLGGSLHCVSMCGPLLLLVNRGGKYRNQLTYHFSRIMVYGMLGVAAGIIGQGIAWTSGQQVLSLLIGGLLVLSVFFPSWFSRWQLKPWAWVKSKLTGNGSREMTRNVTLGIINGLLPCGLTYAALAMAVSQASWVGGLTYMLLFGLGTLPLLVVLAYGSGWFQSRFTWGSRWMKISTLLVAGLLLVRGMGLGIPYLSPDFQPIDAAITLCK